MGVRPAAHGEKILRPREGAGMANLSEDAAREIADIVEAAASSPS